MWLITAQLAVIATVVFSDNSMKEKNSHSSSFERQNERRKYLSFLQSIVTTFLSYDKVERSANVLNRELQRKYKEIAEMISSVRAFRVKLVLWISHMKRKLCLNLVKGKKVKLSM
jgi:hypothetical protein